MAQRESVLGVFGVRGAALIIYPAVIGAWIYVDEFVFRHNRRRQPMAAFQTLLGLGTGRKPTAYQQIRGCTDLFRPLNQVPTQY